MSTSDPKVVDTEDLELTKKYIQGLLHDQNIKNLFITFDKADGSERTMRCTLVEGKIPEDKKPKGTGRESSDSVQRVFDLDKQEWRSFKVDLVKEINFDL